MTSLALLFVLLAALGHTVWNYLAKASRDKIAFLWLLLVAAVGLFGVPFAWWLPRHPIPAEGWPYIFATGLVHAFYFWFLGAAYERGDLSTVYPLARGTAPVLVPFAAGAWLHEWPSALGAVGLGLVVAGIYLVNLPGFSRAAQSQAWRALRHGPVRLAFLTGLMTTLYTLIDRQGVRRVDPFVYIYLLFALSALFQAPWLWRHKRSAVREEWGVHRWRVGLVGLLCLGSYLLILSAMATPSKLSYITAGRESSIFFSALFGVRFLREPHGLAKIVGAAVIVLGVGCLAVAR